MMHIKLNVVHNHCYLPIPDLSTLSCIQDVDVSNLAASPTVPIPTVDHITLQFTPSLNYLRVLSGQDSSSMYGPCSEQEFLTNTLAHTLWCYQQLKDCPNDQGLALQDCIDLQRLCEKLFQAQMIESIFCTPENSHHIEHLWRELTLKGELFIHNHDGHHAFYLEIRKSSSHMNQQSHHNENRHSKELFDVIFYNAGKGFGCYQWPKNILTRSRKKIYTKEVFSNIKLNKKQLGLFVANLKKRSLDNPFLPSIYFLYWMAYLTHLGSRTPPHNTTQEQGKLQARQQNRTCQIKSLKVVAKQTLSNQCYKHWKKNLLLNAIEHVKPVDLRFDHKLLKTKEQIKHKIQSICDT